MSDFKAGLLTLLRESVEKHKKKAWTTAKKDLLATVDAMDECFKKVTGGKYGVQAAHQGNVDNYTRLFVVLWDCTENKSIGALDQYLVDTKGHYPIVAVIAASPQTGGQAMQIQIVDQEGLQNRLSMLLMDIQSPLMELIAKNAVPAS